MATKMYLSKVLEKNEIFKGYKVFIKLTLLNVGVLV
jgi:hypothetical protein